MSQESTKLSNFIKAAGSLIELAPASPEVPAIKRALALRSGMDLYADACRELGSLLADAPWRAKSLAKWMNADSMTIAGRSSWNERARQATEAMKGTMSIMAQIKKANEEWRHAFGRIDEITAQFKRACEQRRQAVEAIMKDYKTG